MRHICFYKARRYGIAAYVAAAYFLRYTLGKAYYARLAGRIGALPAITFYTYYRAHINDAAGAALHHRLYYLLGEVVHTFQVGGHYIVPLLRCKAQQQVVLADARIIHTYIYSTKVFYHIGGQLFCSLKVACIAFIALGLYAHSCQPFFQGLGPLFRRQIGKGYVCAMLGKFYRHRFTYSSACTGHQCYLIFQQFHPVKFGVLK